MVLLFNSAEHLEQKKVHLWNWNIPNTDKQMKTFLRTKCDVEILHVDHRIFFLSKYPQELIDMDDRFCLFYN